MDFSAYAPLLISAGFGYLLGSIPFGLILTRQSGIDLRSVGSGSIGATNVLRTGKRGLAAATVLLDGGKGALALVIAHYVFGREAGFAAGGAAFLGHCFPVWLKFNGGKGVATFFGLMLIGMPPVGIACGLVWLMVAVVFQYSSLAALCASLAAPIFAYVFHQGWLGVGFAAALWVLIWIRHISNIKALLAGQERKIELSAKKPA